MSEAERIEAMRVYERQQEARRQAAQERARRQAVERERQAALERERRERIEAIHRGEGAYGELIRVRLQGGKVKIGDSYHRYQPIQFTIADGETRKISVPERRGKDLILTITYLGGSLALDGAHFHYDRRWGKGALYANTAISGPLTFQGVDLFIEVHNHSSRFDRELPPLVILRDEPPAIIREREHPRPQPETTPGNDGSRTPRVPSGEKDGPKPAPITSREKENHNNPPVRQPVLPAPDRESARQPLPQSAPSMVARPPRTVTVALLSGQLKVRGQNQQVEQSTVRITEGENRKLLVKAGGESRALSVYYRNGELSIDGAQGRGRDGVRFHFDKEWKGGKVYRFALKGKVSLEQVEVRVTSAE